MPQAAGSLRLDEACRLALAAQGFGRARPARPGAAAIVQLVDRLGLVQIDSVNVVSRSHYLPIFSRLGSYDRGAYERLAYVAPRRLFEYWGHEASLLPVGTYPLLRWRMDAARDGAGMWSGVARVGRERPAVIERLRATIASDGPLAASDFEGSRSTGSWWGWSEVKSGLEFLFWSGVVTTATRRPSFERVYDLTDRVLPAAVLAAPVPSAAEAKRELVAISARALGVATETDLRDYFRLDVAGARVAIAELVEERRLLPIAVEGWKGTAYRDPARSLPRAVAGSALLSPFDSLIWHRPRASRLFGFDFRLEIYTPAHLRVHGYYVLPYLVDGRFVARIDVKADRKAGVLRVHAVHYETGSDRAETRERLALDVELLATWLGLGGTSLP